MNDRAWRARNRIEGTVDEIGPRLREDLNRHIRGNRVRVDELAHEVEIGLRCRRKADLDLFEP